MNTKQGGKKGLRTRRERYGKGCHREWGKKGGNPMLLKIREQKNKQTG